MIAIGLGLVAAGVTRLIAELVLCGVTRADTQAVSLYSIVTLVLAIPLFAIGAYWGWLGRRRRYPDAAPRQTPTGEGRHVVLGVVSVLAPGSLQASH
jgi:hypothetical protein